MKESLEVSTEVITPYFNTESNKLYLVQPHASTVPALPSRPKYVVGMDLVNRNVFGLVSNDEQLKEMSKPPVNEESKS